MNLYEAIYLRRSVRKYRMETIEEEILKGISKMMEETQPLFPDVRMELVLTDNVSKGEKVGGLVNVSAPYYLTIYTEEKEKSSMNAGYMMQQISLYLFTKGVGSCFLGMAKHKDKKLKEAGMHPEMVMAFGYPQTSMSRHDYEAKRLSLDELCVYKEAPKNYVKEILEAARLSPSAVNAQPWRFVVYEKRIHVFAKNPKLFQRHSTFEEFNFGIMLANVMIVAEEMWVEADLIKLDNITHKSLSNNRYVISILLKK